MHVYKKIRKKEKEKDLTKAVEVSTTFITTMT